MRRDTSCSRADSTALSQPQWAVGAPPAAENRVVAASPTP
jgi:hypothetical protein